MKVHIGGKETSNQRQNIIWKCILKNRCIQKLKKQFVFFTIMRLLKFRIIKESAEFLNWIQSETTN